MTAINKMLIFGSVKAVLCSFDRFGGPSSPRQPRPCARASRELRGRSSRRSLTASRVTMVTAQLK